MPRQSPLKTIQNASSQIMAGFIVIFILIGLLMVLWTSSLSENKFLVQEMAGESIEVHRVSKMTNAMHMQAMALQHLQNAASPEEKVAAYLKYKGYGETTESISKLIASGHMESAEHDAWQKISSHLSELSSITDHAESLFTDNKQEESYQFLIDKMPFIQNNLMENITNLLSNDLLNESHKEVNNIISEVTLKNETTTLLLFLLGGISILLVGFMVFILRRTSSIETSSVEQGERLRDLYEATSISGISLDEKISETLRLGCRVLGMEIGKLGRQDPSMNTSTFLNTIAPADLPAKRGLVLPLDKTFCNVTFSSEGPIAIHHVSKSSYKNHPAAAFLGMEAYIGTTIFVNDTKYGTVNFSNRKPRTTPFTTTDIDFVNLLGKWISITMEQIVSEEALKIAKEEAEAANYAKSSFLANMSHEIRTPLTAILGYSEMLLEDDGDKTQEETRHEINSIVKSGSHLHEIINDILDLSKIEAGQLVIEHIECPVINLIDEIELIFGRQAREKGLEFNINYGFPIPEKISTDPTRFKQILINLCSNAIKFTKEGSVTINVEFLDDENQLQISVEDTGVGMSNEETAGIFKPFSQADDSTTRKFGGTGLGLCISKQLAQKMGGDITVDSEKDKGSIFTAVIDAGIAGNKLNMIHEIMKHNIHDEEKAIPIPRGLSGHVLLVEDTPENQQLISKHILKTGLTIDIADNGLIGLNMATENKYDLILMDIQMPVMDGLEATRRLRKTGMDAPIICITANAMKDDKQRCFEAGADGYLTKPLDLTRFYQILKTSITSADIETDSSNTKMQVSTSNT